MLALPQIMVLKAERQRWRFYVTINPTVVHVDEQTIFSCIINCRPHIITSKNIDVHTANVIIVIWLAWCCTLVLYFLWSVLVNASFHVGRPEPQWTGLQHQNLDIMVSGSDPTNVMMEIYLHNKNNHPWESPQCITLSIMQCAVLSPWWNFTQPPPQQPHNLVKLTSMWEASHLPRN